MRIHALFCLIIAAINATPITWTTLPITMPFSRHAMMTAFDIHSGFVWILGGRRVSDTEVTDDDHPAGMYTDDIYQWNMTSDDFTYVGELSHQARSSSQNWVTKDRIIYWVDWFSESIRSFSMSSAMEIANDLDASFPFRTKHSCVTTDEDQYLIIVGGFNHPRNYTQIYSFETKEWLWLSNMPQLNQGRYWHSCHVYNASYVYAIGGYVYTGSSIVTKTIEKLDLETMTNWIVSPHELTQERGRHRSVLINDFIIVTGGKFRWSYNKHFYNNYLKSVEIISMVDDSITSATDLNIAVSRHGIVRGPMNNVFVLGGYTSSGRTNEIQVANTLSATRASDFFYPAPTTTVSTTEDSNDPNLSKKSTNVATYLVVGAICFFLFCIFCFGMRRKMRNKNDGAEDDDPQNEENNAQSTRQYQLVDVNDDEGADQGESKVTVQQMELMKHLH